MILISRGEEPALLRDVRQREMERVRAIARARPPTSKEIGAEYQCVKDTLWEAQHYKCCFCETQEQKKRNDVEHYRPKAKAVRLPGSDADHGYWWLAWTWENLLFCCRNCNQLPAKGVLFPLTAGDVPLAAEQNPPGNERPLLVDPATECGVDHIEFAIDARGRWIPRARDGSQKGDWTIRVCQLDRPELLTSYGWHVERVVKFEVTRLKEAMAAADGQIVRKVLDDVTGRLLASHCRFAGLSYDALCNFVQADLAAWGLAVPRPE